MKIRLEHRIESFSRHRTALFISLILCLLLAAFAVCRASYTNDVSLLFPSGAESGYIFRIVNHSHIADTVQLEFLSDRDVTQFEPYLDAAAARLASCPGVRSVLFRYRSGTFFSQAVELSSVIPRFYSPDVLLQCDPEAAAEKALKQLSLPIPGGVKFLREQPFFMETDLLNKMRKLERLTGMTMDQTLPYFASMDRRRALIVLESDIVVGDADSVRNLFHEIGICLDPLPDGLRYEIISGGQHTLGNESVLKRDATLAAMISIVLFLLLFFVFFRRDPDALWIPVLPFAASLAALGIMTLFFREICWYVVGLGSCITGLAIDQGIHAYTACRSEGRSGSAAGVTVPMILSAATSVFVFVLLAFTGITAYVQLAVFAGLSLTFSCLLALFVLPLLLHQREKCVPRIPAELSAGRRTARIGLFLILFAGIAAVPFLVPDFSLDALDGTPVAIRTVERDFQNVWRKNAVRSAVVAVLGKDKDDALDSLLSFAGDLRDRDKIELAVPPLQPEGVQSRNLLLWRDPAVAGQIDDLEKRTASACVKRGLPEKFYQPFFVHLRHSIASDERTMPDFLQLVSRKMLKERPGQTVAIALMEETPENVAAVRMRIKGCGLQRTAAVLSKEAFRQLVKQDLGTPFLLILPFSILGALALAYAVFRRFRDVLLAMVPVAAAAAALSFLGALTRFRVTPAAAFALILLTGLAIDYGIYAVYLVRNGEKRSIRSSVLLSALTTVFGAGALIFSDHPVLFGTGIVLSIGIAVACLAGLYLVPLLASGSGSKTAKVFLLSGFALFFLNGCSAPGVSLNEFPAREKVTSAVSVYPRSPFKIRANAVCTCLWYDIPMILAAEIDPVSKTASVAGLSPAGTLLFRAGPAGYTAGPGVPDNARRIFAGIPEDFTRIFCHDLSGVLAYQADERYIMLESPDGTQWLIDQDVPCLRSRSSGSFPFRKWRCDFSGKTVTCENFEKHYTLRLDLADPSGNNSGLKR